MNKKPITITIDNELDIRIRKIQARLIEHTHTNWSYSKVAHLILEEGIKPFTKSNPIVRKK